MDSHFDHIPKRKTWFLLLVILGAACAVLVSFLGQLEKVPSLNSSLFVDSLAAFHSKSVHNDKPIPYKGHIHNPNLIYDDLTSLEIKKDRKTKSGK